MARGRLRLVVIAVACLLLAPAAQAAPAAHLRSSHDEKEGEKASSSSIGGIRKLTAAEVHELVQARRAAPGPY